MVVFLFEDAVRFWGAVIDLLMFTLSCQIIDHSANTLYHIPHLTTTSSSLKPKSPQIR